MLCPCAAASHPLSSYQCCLDAGLYILTASFQTKVTQQESHLSCGSRLITSVLWQQTNHICPVAGRPSQSVTLLVAGLSAEAVKMKMKMKKKMSHTMTHERSQRWIWASSSCNRRKQHRWNQSSQHEHKWKKKKVLQKHVTVFIYFTLETSWNFSDCIFLMLFIYFWIISKCYRQGKRTAWRF